MRSTIAVALLFLTALPAFGQPKALSFSPGHEPLIVPGSRVGPVVLGMTVNEARAAVARFERESGGCTIDVVIAAGRVIAAGTEWGGCLILAIPEGTPLPMIASDGFQVPSLIGIGGSSNDFISVFGQPLVVHLGGDRKALVWPQGLAAHVGAASHNGGIVTYLAVVAPGSTAVPRIGRFADGPQPAQ